ncbi:hypothetical protein B842_11665 [Corynebacterium humireducens NBRC 106098 = DSM 45392]|uniref:Uncharacterized protein n=1 Tax=Corynebacterium humireducens NBRC 106098 = DSM 45392 TaxID=1223515 RepID=A0A0B5DD66_9CORY|nr:hypothetical protein [Corynebacterium humireducens]AJE34178.1 hypothetical protein B842_11665 [Corynebacterium humireducens NBRC 106098 = DSM 45392]
MDQLTITTAASDHLASLLRRLSPPDPPALPPGSRTAAALDRAARTWAGTHRSAESALRDHVHEVRGFLDRVRALDRSLF